jgi:DNA-binding transcriptional regulator of glucitol operon
VLRIVVLAILAVLLLTAIAIVIRLAMVRRAWDRIRHRLRRRSTEGVVGAWVWARLRLRAYRMPLADRVSPDAIDERDVLARLPTDSAESLRQLAEIVVPAAFAGPSETEFQHDANQAWRLSDEACAAVEATMSRLGRIRLRLASPPGGHIYTNRVETAPKGRLTS